MTTIDGLPLRVFNAGNRGPFTLDGTRTYLVGTSDVLVIDPGPDDEVHVAALSAALAEARRVRIVLTHRHADHAAAAPRLARALGAELWGTGQVGERRLEDGDRLECDAGVLEAVWTPGHCDAHLVFHWPQGASAFCGDLLLGEGSTTWVAGYPTAVADYLASLDRVEALAVQTLIPTHGPPLTDASAALRRFRDHRLERIAQVRAVRADEGHASLESIVDRVYGSALPDGMRRAAEASIAAILDYLAHT